MRDFHLPGRSPVLATNGICATSHPLAARAAVDILARGGNAMDAAIAGAVLLGICEPQMTGIGGDCFVLYSPAGSEEVHALNGSGCAPAALDSAKLRDKGEKTVPLRSADAVTIPTAIDAFCHLSESTGKLGLDALLAPAIHYAEAGVPVAPRVAFDWATDGGTLQGRARDHFLINGKTPRTGDIFRAPGQAEVLRRVAAQGRDAFYTGEIAEDMIATLQAAGGSHSAEDFAKARAEVTTPVSGQYKDLEVVEHPPNGQGATALLLMNILDHFDIAGMDPLGAERLHIEAEATKLAYDARNRFLADPDHTTRLEHMLAPETARALAALIDPKRAMAAAAPINEAVHKDTIYITVVDGDGMSVSLIYSIFHGFGSGIASDKFGILLQNRGAGFTLEEGHPNELKGGKRPMHTIIPGMIRENGRVTMPFGVMGGAYQPCGHARFASNLTDFDMDVQSAIDAPRAFADGQVMKVERGFGDDVRQSLSDLGHRVEVPETAIGGAQAIRIREDGVLEGASDPRKDGCALGY
ncbi:gamma-glutamyltransferase family protein [Sulfitobacter sp. KE29]|uniref:gamma-glutamyltransferase family protein n=1 Tax=unclassified Sulfitobacter TaxID=196795 RepID=UPI0023E15103|nr:MULTISPECIES: gamma-glutamyltransferase family protein [unclassified Sulfitobacter]MDF3417763.1 gamma-glutamyltransferase family protein [Sulfitobacter sp. Ks38]MDF3425245.1 gamma-glutamyltransferase family protein [Sulfitobacter sp. KE29]MDF3428826.1 gamma-glutamyltransferase family protein [Sulfitobacter sp. S46]MDF3443598.1 gamma-glutamyltransferase family protein [Sulfitobacter sp. KE31]MDF3547623.1 gamma-glutamyltransferase family protein [Sulfitobacter sp. KE28]